MKTYLGSSGNFDISHDPEDSVERLQSYSQLDNPCGAAKDDSRRSPIEILLLICDGLDVTDLNALAKTCKFIFNLLDPLLYQRALKSPECKAKFLYAVIHGQANAVSKFWKAGLSMSEFKDYTDDFHRSRTNFASSVSAAKRKVLEMRFHPLLAAVLFGHVEVVAMLIGSVNVDFQDKSHRTALWYAIEDDRLDVIKLLLKKGATITNIVASKNQRSSPFICAADIGNKTALEMMLNELHNRSTPAKVIKEQCETACYRACLNGFANIVDFLLRHKVVDVNLCVRKRRLLYWASHYGSLPTVKALVSHGAIMEKETDCGVVSAIFHGYWDEEQRYGRKSELGILLYLLESGCNVANGGLHACALWRIVHASKTVYAPERRGFNGTPAQRNQIIKLLQRNGFDKKKCQNKCWQGDFDDILERKLYSSQFLQYITELSEGSK